MRIEKSKGSARARSERLNSSFHTAADNVIKGNTARHHYTGQTLADENMRGMGTKSYKRGADNFQKVNSPQRIELPIYFNTPRRFDLSPKMKQRTQSVDIGPKSEMANTIALKSSDPTRIVNSKRRLKDYGILAFACKRAGKLRDEGRSYYSMGVLCDNVGKFHEGIAHYQKFLDICKKIGDQHGEALAYNCIAVNYQYLGEHANVKYYEEAIQYHNKHKELADIAGKFIAHVNLGIIYEKMGNQERSSINHQFALRYAVQMSSVQGQGVAIGNLGKIGTTEIRGDGSKMKMFIEKYIDLCGEVRDRKAEGGAYLALGHLSQTQKEYGLSSKNYYRALKISEETGDSDTHMKAKCHFGVANGQLKMNDHMRSILKSLDSEGS